MNMQINAGSKACFCGVCTAPVTDMDTGETVCGKCGMVLDSGTAQPHATDNHALLGNNMSSTKVDGDARMRRASQMANKVDHSGLTAKSTTTSCCAKLGLPSAVGSRALSLFKKFRAELRGRNVAVLTAAVLYIACREHLVPRSMVEICTAMNVNHKHVRKAYKRIRKSYAMTLPIQTSEGFATRISSNMGLPEQVSRKALDILNGLGRSGLNVGRHPQLVAAYAVYMAARDCGIDVAAATVAAASGITAPGILNLVKAVNAEKKNA